MLTFKPTLPLQDRVALFHDNLQQLLSAWQPQVLAIETPFLGKNAQNFLKLGYLRGIVYLFASKQKIMLTELAPREVKLAVTGSGNADKTQVARAIHALFPQLPVQKKYDITDALAVALGAAWMSSNRLQQIRQPRRPELGR